MRQPPAGFPTIRSTAPGRRGAQATLGHPPIDRRPDKPRYMCGWTARNQTIGSSTETTQLLQPSFSTKLVRASYGAVPQRRQGACRASRRHAIGGSPDHSPALAAAQHTNGLRASRNGQVPVGLGDLGIEGDRQGAVASIMIRAIGAWSAGIATCAAATSCSRLRSENPPLASHSDDLSRAVQADAVHQARNRKVGNPCPRLATAGSDRQAGEQGVVGWR